MKKVTCQGCKFFYVSYRLYKPWGCKKFGFISKNLPYQVVFSTTGIECAFKTEKKNKR